MLLALLFSQLVMAQTPLFEADCGDLQDPPNGPPSMVTPYTGIRIRFDNGQYQLTVESLTSGAKRTVPLHWEAGYQQHVARFANGEVWRVSPSPGGLTVHLANKSAKCVSSAVAIDPFSGNILDPDKVWKAVRDTSGGCFIEL